MSRKSRMRDWEEELRVVVECRAKGFPACKGFPSRVDNIMSFNLQRKSKILDGYVNKLMESDDLEATTRQMQEHIIRDPRVAVVLKPMVVERLVKILNENNNKFVKGCAACIMGFANFDECGLVIKEKATEVLLKLMCFDTFIVTVPVVSALTRLAYVYPDYSSFIVERGALEVALTVVKTVHERPRILQSLSKFMAVIVSRVEVPSHKVSIIVTILGTMLEIRERDPCHIVGACYSISLLSFERSVIFEKEICNKVIRFINDPDYMVAHSALRVVANIVKWGKPCEIQILTKHCEFLQCLGRIELCRKPKMFWKEACNIISDIATKGGTSIEDMHEAGLIDTLHKLLEVDDFDVKMEAVCAIFNIVRGDRFEEIGEHDKGRYSTEYSHYELSLFV